MTKFEELTDITHNRNKGKKKKATPFLSSPNQDDNNNDIELEVSGTESTRAPLVSFGDEETDPDLIDQLYRSNRNRVLRGEGASYWDSDY